MSVFSYISQPRGFALMRIVCEGMADSIFVWLCLSFLLNSKSSISCLLSLVYHLYYRHFSQIYYLSLNFVNGSFHTLKFEILHSLVHMSFFCSFRVSNLRKFTLTLRLYLWPGRVGFTFLFPIHLEGCIFFFSAQEIIRVYVFTPPPTRFIMSLPTQFINNPFIFIDLNCPPCHT